ncbi:hypothetical protein [Zhongshania marina]|uniref:Uncharacterized protein n=1 Tax=Zhongshania marina TaxID=2304603 RepID=A0A2S4HGD2_9GAMM|nr:hypothetical protein [Marortus luteolus]POP53055.1 hypothetical protein C0068_08160 [Marortus luteolus]
MGYIVSYIKYTDAVTTKSLLAPEGSTELCTLEGVTYVAIPDGETLPENQPAEIAASIETVTLTDTLKASIKAASPHCALIAKRVEQKIRDQYSQEDEFYFARISIGVLTSQYTFEAGEADAVADFGVYVEECRQWGRDQRAALGL